MEAYQMSEEERVWLESYDINQFDSYSPSRRIWRFSLFWKQNPVLIRDTAGRITGINSGKRTETSADQKRFFSLSGLLGSAGRFWQAVREHTGNRIS